MTTAVETQANEKELAKKAAEARATEIAEKEAKANEGRTGRGLRVFYGMTRGRNTTMISYENWDESQPETLPDSIANFVELRKLSDADLLKRLIAGDNEILYSEASDPISEFVDPTWDEEVQKRFRVSVRNYSVDTGMSIEDAANVLKPAIAKAQAKKVAAAA